MDILTCEDPEFYSRYNLFCSKESFYSFYSPLDIEYYKAYYKDSEFYDLSFLTLYDNTPIISVIIALRKFPNGKIELSSFGNPISYLESPSSNSDVLTSARKIFKKKIESIFDSYRNADILYQDPIPNGKLSVVSSILLDKGAKASPFFTRIIDLSESETDIRKRIRKSYKSLINWGNNNLKIVISDSSSVSESEFYEFRKLHFEAAKRETRSIKTWKIQYNKVLADEAFIVLGYMEKKMVTAAFFSYNRKKCYYGVSASNRDMFDKPLSHAIIWQALLHAKKLGCRFFETGGQSYPNQGDPLPSSKELGISKFKGGFRGKVKVMLDVNLRT